MPLLIVYLNFRYDSDEFWECAVRYYTGPENHQACSCKMGPSNDPMAVVNNKLQVYGIDGLRIMDASVMPILVSGNTATTTVLIAERGVEFIKSRWQNSQILGNRAGFGGGVAQSPPKSSALPSSGTGGVKTQQNYPHKGITNTNFHHSESFHKQHPSIPDPFKNGNNNNNYMHNEGNANAKPFPHSNYNNYDYENPEYYDFKH